MDLNLTKTDGYARESVRKTLARISVVTLAVTALSLSVFEFVRILFSVANEKKYDSFESLYYMFGDKSVSIVDLILGLLIFAVLIFATVGVFMCRSAAVKNNTNSLSGGITIITAALVGAVVVEVVYIVISLASVSVCNYEYYNSLHSKAAESREFPIGLFFGTVITGAAVLTLTISLLRLMISFKKNMNTKNEFFQKGAALSMVSSIVGSVIMSMVFTGQLFSLVLPNYSASELAAPDPVELVVTMLNILISAAATVALIDLSIIIGYFGSFADRFSKMTGSQNQISTVPSYYPPVTTSTMAYPAYTQNNSFVDNKNNPYHPVNMNSDTRVIPAPLPRPVPTVPPIPPHPMTPPNPTKAPVAPAMQQKSVLAAAKPVTPETPLTPIDNSDTSSSEFDTAELDIPKTAYPSANAEGTPEAAPEVKAEEKTEVKPETDEK